MIPSFFTVMLPVSISLLSMCFNTGKTDTGGLVSLSISCLPLIDAIITIFLVASFRRRTITICVNCLKKISDNF